ncbi:hypothetical protein SNEBB_003856 [Seison nebaliae]|nr:hypothetical protein SNEBB_003856 [Seison nebaliae]
MAEMVGDKSSFALTDNETILHKSSYYLQLNQQTSELTNQRHHSHQQLSDDEKTNNYMSSYLNKLSDQSRKKRNKSNEEKPSVSSDESLISVYSLITYFDKQPKQQPSDSGHSSNYDDCSSSEESNENKRKTSNKSNNLTSRNNLRKFDDNFLNYLLLYNNDHQSTGDTNTVTEINQVNNKNKEHQLITPKEEELSTNSFQTDNLEPNTSHSHNNPIFHIISSSFPSCLQSSSRNRDKQEGEMETNHHSDNVPDLFVRAGMDNRSYGACPFCQQIFMALLLKADNENGLLKDFTVTAINLKNPPANFRNICRAARVPVFVHNEQLLTDVLEIHDYIDYTFQSTETDEHEKFLNDIYPSTLATKAMMDVYYRFTHLIRSSDRSRSEYLKNKLVNELEKINQFLNDADDASRSTRRRFLCGNELTRVDCELLPKLQHIRVAGKALVNFQIPENLTNVWKYLGYAYDNEIFIKTCPNDLEIVDRWASTIKRSYQSNSVSKDISTSLPSGILLID